MCEQTLPHLRLNGWRPRRPGSGAHDARADHRCLEGAEALALQVARFVVAAFPMCLPALA